MKIRDFIIEQLINKEATIVAQTIIDEINKKLDRLKEEIFATNDMEEVKRIKVEYDELDKLLTDVASKPLEVDLDEVTRKLNSLLVVPKITNALNEKKINDRLYAINITPPLNEAQEIKGGLGIGGLYHQQK